jgi:hypothetical protein
MKKVIALLVMLMMLSTPAFAWRGGRGCYHHGGGWGYGGALLGGLVAGAIIESAFAPHYRTVYLGGVPYYTDGVYYYQPSPVGYVVVQPPVQVIQPPPQQVVQPAVVQPQVIAGSESFRVPNENGSYMLVAIQKDGEGYSGPQGEHYEKLPTLDQLKKMYGR